MNKQMTVLTAKELMKMRRLGRVLDTLPVPTSDRIVWDFTKQKFIAKGKFKGR